MNRAEALIFLLACASCATLVAPGPDLVPVNSTPPGARVVVNGAVVNLTPMLLPIQRGGGDWFHLQLQADGFESREVVIGRVCNGWIFGNILFDGVISVIIDGITGNSMKVPAAEVVDEDLARPSTRPSTRPAPQIRRRPPSDPSSQDNYGTTGH